MQQKQMNNHFFGDRTMKRQIVFMVALVIAGVLIGGCAGLRKTDRYAIDEQGNKITVLRGGSNSTTAAFQHSVQARADGMRAEKRAERREMFRSANDPWRRTRSNIHSTQRTLLGKHMEVMRR